MTSKPITIFPIYLLTRRKWQNIGIDSFYFYNNLNSQDSLSFLIADLLTKWLLYLLYIKTRFPLGASLSCGSLNKFSNFYIWKCLGSWQWCQPPLHPPWVIWFVAPFARAGSHFLSSNQTPELNILIIYSPIKIKFKDLFF